LQAQLLLALVIHGIDLFALDQRRHNLACPRIFVGGLFSRSRDDQRSARFVNQDGINFIHDGVVVAALDAILDLELHVVAQVVETEFVVGSVGDVGGIRLPALVVVQIVNDDADRESEELVDLAHPLGIALGQIVVHRDHMHAVAGQRIQIAGERGDQRLAFAGLHLADLALVQHHAADQLYVEVAHLHRAPAGLADHRKGLGQNLVQRLFFGGLAFILVLGVVGNILEALGDPLAELDGLGAQFVVGEAFGVIFQSAYQGHHGHQALDQPLVRGAENLR